ncbi:triose-phosphate isomerase [Pseudoroseicyclus aestuarii]|uniref:Triosephosphate isomerase n=1 Tax=Pseudoroseicyclus aestuarii TaxID=1795041 RepID=A0A318SSZ5_9RHOB|nr:triose-phosphate isomerase [Pseudoroseicyclus aestuarii]PYE84833.1 triosephosphate isomerase [Pseudoroseicyclus aestuarii]
MESTRRQVWIGTSWKMNKTLAEALRFADRLKAEPTPAGIQRFVVPPFTTAREVAARLDGSDTLVGAQNMHWAAAGAWTGEISASMLVDCGLDLVELGHSERRHHFGETDETVGLKVAAAVAEGLTPLICIGETAEEKDAGEADAVLRRQVESALALLDEDQRGARILLAYEPVWAIGDAGVPADPGYAAARHEAIAEVARQALGHKVPCLYGGSVNAGNCTDLITRPSIDGLFIGRAAWAVEGYLDILSRCAAALQEETTS